MNPRASDPVEVHIEPTHGWQGFGVREVLDNLELLRSLTMRDVIIRYKQTILGMAWAVLQPLMAMVVFALVLNGAAGVRSEPGVPYPIFSYAGLLVWLYFSEGVNRASKSLVTNSLLVTKVYFPRLVAPLSGVLAPLVDFAIAFVILLGLMAYYGTHLSWTLTLVVPFLLIAIVCATAFGIWLAALNVEYRDVGYAVPLALQLAMFLTPVVYPAQHVHGALRVIYAINPMATVVAGFRWAILGSAAPDWDLALPSMLVLAFVFVTGVMYFRRTERTFADAI